MEIERKALSRPFSLGMLYDSCSDKLIPGISLWDIDTLEKHIQRQEMPNSNFRVVSDDTIADKSSALGVEGDLKMSLLGGLVNLEGAGSYFQDSKESSEKVRVTLKYESSSHFDQLNIQRSPIKYPEVFGNCNATHVVTGIEWGADAFFVFEKSSHTMANSSKVHGQLEGVVKSIISCNIQGTADYKSQENQDTQSISCHYHGDFQLETIPTTYKDALLVIKTLPGLLKKNPHVPKRVYLYPLCKLNSKAAALRHSISGALVDHVECILQEYVDCRAKVTPITESSAVAVVPFLKEDLRVFKRIINLATTLFKEQLMPLLTAVRSGTEQEQVLSMMLSRWETSAASPYNFGTVLIGIEYTVAFIENLLKSAKDQGIPEAFGPDLVRITSDVDKGAIVCLTFNADVLKSKGLSVIGKFLSNPDPPVTTLPMEWHKSDKLTATNETFCLFREYAKINKDGDWKIKYVITDGDALGSKEPVVVQIFEEGRETINLANAPGKPHETGETTATETSLAWASPTKGAEAVQRHILWYCPGDDDEGWKRVDGKYENAKTYAIHHLKPGMKYLYKVQAVTKAGISPTSPVSEPVLTKDKD